MDNQSRLISEIPPAPGGQGGVKEQDPGERSLQRLREVQVSGRAEVHGAADRGSLSLRFHTSKDSVNEASCSVSRRLDYILQTIRQNGVPDKDASVRKLLQREGEQYHMDAEVLVVFSNFETMEHVRSVLLEKMDSSVCVGAPKFYHSTELLIQMRQRACAAAVQSAHQKARDISQMLGHSLGPPLLVREEETKEWRNEEEEEAGRSPHLAPHTVTVLSLVSASFSLRDRSRKKV